jgi:hypothetical protein
MDEYRFGLDYYGRDADRARLDLYDASISYYGFARTLAIIGHYYATGEIIAHAPKAEIQIFLTPPEEGSFRQTVIAGVVGAVIAAPFTTFVGELVKTWVPGNDAELKKIVQLLEAQNKLLQGLQPKPSTSSPGQAIVHNHIETHQTEMDVLRSITSNSFRNTFRPIGRSADVVSITKDQERTPITNVNQGLLDLMSFDQVDEEIVEIKARVNAFSRSSNTGIAFSEEISRGFRFEYKGEGKLPREDIFSYSQYYGREIYLTGRFVRFFDGTIKKFLVFRARKSDEDFE